MHDYLTLKYIVYKSKCHQERDTPLLGSSTRTTTSKVHQAWSGSSRPLADSSKPPFGGQGVAVGVIKELCVLGCGNGEIHG